jgi:Fe-S-cluster containining protein
MPRYPLPLTDPARTEFGFQRTVCSCLECTLNCRHIPGYLIPADLERIKNHLAADANLLGWAKQHLLASPGALVAANGMVFRIPTLVPARATSGACIFLTDDDRCAIHPVAPFGCAFFDAHMPKSEADRRSRHGLEDIYKAWVKGDEYGQVWLALDREGLQAPSPEQCRQQLKTAIDQG